jgi:hypothetical protein
MLVPVVTTRVLYPFPAMSAALRSFLSDTEGNFACMADILIIIPPGLCPQVVATRGVSTFGKANAKNNF